MEGAPWLRSIDVLAVWRDCGRWNGLELVSEVVGVADEVDHPRRLRVLNVACSEPSSKWVRVPETSEAEEGAGSVSVTSRISFMVKGVLMSRSQSS